MDPLSALAILITGLVMGWINNLAGAAGALGLLAFDFVLGLGHVEQNASLRLSALAIGVAGLVGFWSKQQVIPRRMWVYGALTIPGAVLGAMMAVSIPAFVHQLTLAAVLLLVLGQQMHLKRGPSTDQVPKRPTPGWLLFVLFTWLGIHMGFIQVATGLISIFILSIVHSRDLVQVNAAKMVLVIVSALTSTVTLAFSGKVVWGAAAVLAVGAGIGSFVASRWSVRKGHGAVRVVVVTICVFTLGKLGIEMFA